MSNDTETRAPAESVDRESSALAKRSVPSLTRLLPGVDRYSALYLWAIFMIVFGVLKPDEFLTVPMAQLVFTQGAVTAVLALAFLIPLTADTFDLSVGAMLSLTIVLMNWFVLNTGLSVAVVAPLVVLICGLIGVLTGFIVVKLRVNSLIATLGMLSVLTAAQLFISQNKQLAAPFPEFFTKLGNGDLLGVPYIAIHLLVIAVVLWFVLEQTPVGRRMFAIGGNKEAARLAGIRTDRIVWTSLIASAVVAGIAGVMYTSYVGPYSGDVGSGFLFPALAAVFFGASQLRQRPNVWGTLIAYFALAFGIQGLMLQAGAGAFWVGPLFQGVALIAAVAVATLRGAVGGTDAGPTKS
ncbi:ABC transporter permease [Streptomyces sp. NPDC002405]